MSMKLNDHTEVKLLSMAFTYHLIKELEIGAIDEINKLNASHEYKGRCASNDFCDTFTVMTDAIECLGEEYGDRNCNDLINEAWARAKKLKFDPENVNGCDCLGSCLCLPIPSDHKVFGVQA